ncbi:MAG: single-stranded DNA-binding protein [Candidatus Obscuribacterales bacterium]|nr:single-stranded DNA-binding protein [Candidatus Obscuribacterales bacterium]
MSVNNVVLVGRVSREPEARYFESGKKKVDFSIALQRPTKEKQVDFIDVRAWGDQVDTVNQYVRKGDMVGIIGRLEVDKWESQSGEKRSRTLVNCQRVELMPNGKKDQGDQGADSSDDYDPFA